MHELIERLHTEHTELQRALAGIRPRQFRTEEGRHRIKRVRDLFRKHMQRERDKLYPAIEKAAKGDTELATRLQRLGDDLRIVSDLAENFFDKYIPGSPQLIEFATDHGALLTILKIRLRREEEFVFPLYADLTDN